MATKIHTKSVVSLVMRFWYTTAKSTNILCMRKGATVKKIKVIQPKKFRYSDYRT